MAPGVAPRIVVFVLLKSLNAHSEIGILRSQNQFLNAESCSKNALELSQSSENGPLTQRVFFLKLGWSPGF